MADIYDFKRELEKRVIEETGLIVKEVSRECPVGADVFYDSTTGITIYYDIDTGHVYGWNSDEITFELEEKWWERVVNYLKNLIRGE